MERLLTCDISVKTEKSAKGNDYKVVVIVLPDGRVVKSFDKDLMNAVLLCMLEDL